MSPPWKTERRPGSEFTRPANDRRTNSYVNNQSSRKSKPRRRQSTAETLLEVARHYEISDPAAAAVARFLAAGAR